MMLKEANGWNLENFLINKNGGLKMYDESEKKYKLIEAIQDFFGKYREKPLSELFILLKGLTPDKIKNFLLSVYQSKIYKDTEEEENDKALIAEIEEKF